MKKNIIAILLATFIIPSFALFAALPAPSDLYLLTSISGINLMKITESQFNPSTPSVYAFNNATANPTNETVSTDTDGDTIAWLSILTNRRTGFTVEMTATPLVSADTENTYEINYIATVGSATYNTSDETGTNSITEDSGIAGLSAFSYAIAVDLDDNEFAMALADTYTGTITFTYTANS
ncbi:hypothetical protein [uncultured Sphaerochaeta sp.]|uniref:hypothetical protein n=1 Tax=uncultured Sphaerochaeta sp. TaxID=886478 RepID=UPI002A0A65D5|nr:hypothetical protein [uncultured Sphaerochaeta sp.]